MKKLCALSASAFFIFQNNAMQSNPTLLQHISKISDRIYCIGETSSCLEQMLHEVEIADTALATLIERGASIEESTANGVTPLMAASRNGLAPFVARLLKAGAKADAIDKDGFTALDYAIAYSIPPVQTNIFAFIPWAVTYQFRAPGRRVCVQLLRNHLHLEKVAVQERLAELIERLRKDEPTAYKNKLRTELSHFLLAE